MGLVEGSRCFLVSETFGNEKPHPSIFLKALEHLGAAKPQETLFVGDNPIADIQGAQQIGMALCLDHPRKVMAWGPDTAGSPRYVGSGCLGLAFGRIARGHLSSAQSIIAQPIY